MTPTYPHHAVVEAIPGSLTAARKILPIVWGLRKFEKIIDVGCGAGAWLYTAQKLGVCEIVGIDGQPLPDQALCVPREIIRICDLALPLQAIERFDLCISLEVAEHLPCSRGASFVRELCSFANIVLFSAAVPFQGGYGHINEQWPLYWAKLFSEHGFDVWDGIRMRIWAAQEIPWWYRQNILLFVRRSDWRGLFPHAIPNSIDQLSLVHPECYLRQRRKDKTDLEALYGLSNQIGSAGPVVSG